MLPFGMISGTVLINPYVAVPFLWIFFPFPVFVLPLPFLSFPFRCYSSLALPFLLLSGAFPILSFSFPFTFLLLPSFFR